MSRWRCPECKSTKLQICLPAWFSETKLYGLTHESTVEEADIMAWYCQACDESDNGEPEVNE